MKLSKEEINEFANLWRDKWSNSPPLLPEPLDRWVRFHNLPNSKRYPTDEKENAIILERQNTLLSELGAGESLIVVVPRWNQDATTPPDISDLLSGAVFWQTLKEDPEENNPEFITYRHVYIKKCNWERGLLDKLLLAVAKDEEAGVVLAPQGLEWLFCPYDGGVDIYLPDSDARNSLERNHKDWLPQNEAGL